MKSSCVRYMTSPTYSKIGYVDVKIVLKFNLMYTFTFKKSNA